MADTLPRTLAAGTGPAVVENGTPASQCEHTGRSAFARLVEAHQSRVAGLAYRLLGWRDDVEDVVQDVFLSAYKNMGAFRGDAAVGTWLTRITINQCRTHRRRQVLRLRFWDTVRQRGGHSAGSQGAPPVGAASDSGSVKAETLAQVREAVRALPHRYREVIVLRYLEELPIRRVAEMLNVTVSAVDVRLNRARRRLREVLGDLAEEAFRGA